MSGSAGGDDPRSANAGRSFAPRDLTGALTQALPETAEALAPGAMFAQRFRIIDRVGSGSVADVYRASDIKSGRDVALKLIRSDRLVTDAKRQDFIREGVRTQELNSKSIVRVFDISDYQGQPYLVMEWLGDLTLRRWLNKTVDGRTPASILTCCNVILALLDGLEEAHERGLVHRDLKPENVILLAEPTDAAASLRIVDFGISASVRELSQTGATGTQDYMPSEQGRGAAPHATADIYALSVIFYEMLIGGTPRHNTSPAASRPDVPAGIDRLVARGLSDFAGSRPQSVAAYRQDLQAAMAAAAIEAEKARAAAEDKRRSDEALAEQEHIRKEKEAATAKAKADREADAARKRAAAAAAAALKAQEPAVADAVKTDQPKPGPTKEEKDGPVMAALGVVFAILAVAAELGGVVLALFLAWQAWNFLTHDFGPTRDFACSIGLKGSCTVVKKGVSLDSLKPKPLPTYSPLDLRSLSLTPSPGVTPTPSPTQSRTPSISDYLIAPATPSPK